MIGLKPASTLGASILEGRCPRMPFLLFFDLGRWKKVYVLRTILWLIVYTD
jgi:hypothetical protein